MTFFNFTILIFLIHSVAFTDDLKTAPQTQAVSGSKFLDLEDRARGLIGKLYQRVFFPVSPTPRKATHLYPGKLYDVGGYRLHLVCTGISKAGDPTVILESGVGSYSASWILIQREISKRVRVCAYDRAGYGWSDEWSELKGIQSVHDVIPRTIDHNVRALDRLLNLAGISEPIVLVGASYGGPLSLAFENQYPNRVRGLVLVDPHDDGPPFEDSLYNDAISNSLRQLEKERSTEGKAEWNRKLAEIAQHLSSPQDGFVQTQILAEDLSSLVALLDPMKGLRSMFSEWRALHSSCAKVKALPSKTIRQKALTVLSSDPTNKRSEGRAYLHMNIAKQSLKGKFLIAQGAGHDIAGDRPDLIIATVGQMLDISNGRSVPKLKEESLPQISEPTRFFVDGEIAESIRAHADRKGTHKQLDEFCRKLGLGFAHHRDSGYVDYRETGAGGYFVVCELQSKQ